MEVDKEIPFAIISWSARKWLLQTTDYANGHYEDVSSPAWAMPRRLWKWAGVYWIYDAKAVASAPLLAPDEEQSVAQAIAKT